ncbi:cobyrinate a,c-diamide synthase [Pseudoroseomonas cervicalis]|uniref:cobyrinate a,c-diamide synthase n=1 Tax=Teichococcus cervicalis TaxID=204525 RepID=UPI0027849224|nr:cobyrinate a,c-diamide synthase [Pseudoroseomonas cervicalis]MDQ1080714.1 cobyrinic acid a,c-diamide synthase [Pseudoroseomonas cervicalis]
MRGLVIAAPRSGAGKSTLTMALLAGFRRRGLAVGGAKSGPDYIDPAFHEAACGRPSPNLDSWAMRPALLDSVAARAAAGLDLLLVESAMGLFDGAGEAPGRQGSAADLAARFGLPVLLLLDVSGQSQSAGAVARGFATHHPGVRLAGVVLNRVASPRHRAGAAGAIAAAGLPVWGALPREPGIALPERHLGLVQAREQGDLPALLDRLAALAEAELDLDAIAAAAEPLPALAAGAAPPLPPPGQRIAIAQDDAFSFLYPHVVAGWRQAGAELLPFSPLADQAPDDSADACWLPGGYPELQAGRLAAATRFLAGLRRFAETRPVHGECGGYMLLGQGLEDAGGRRHAMAGLLGHATSFARRRMTLGYRAARLLADGPLGRAGSLLRGHEFHYATVTEAGQDAPFASLEDAAGRPIGEGGGRRGLVSGSFFHAIATEEEARP